MGEVFAGRYELVDPIGRGGVGAVWRAWDHRRRRYVAAKVLQQSDAHALLRFVREQALRIDHPHVLAPASWAADDDKVLFTMDLVAGGSLVHLVNDYGPLPPPFVCTLLDQLLAGVAAVHAEGVVHRDIKPANVLLEATGTARPRLRLSDFGIAMRLGEPRLTETNYVVGTPGYFAPEQMMGAEPDFPADLFAVGLVALYLLEGAKPDAKALIEYFADNGTPSAPRGIPEPLWQVVATLLQPDPHARFRTATGARKALASATELLPETGPDDELVEVFDQLGPLPEGFTPGGPLRPAPGVSTGGLSSGAHGTRRDTTATQLSPDDTPSWPGPGIGPHAGPDADSNSGSSSGSSSGSNPVSTLGSSSGSGPRPSSGPASSSGPGLGSNPVSMPGSGSGSGSGPWRHGSGSGPWRHGSGALSQEADSVGVWAGSGTNGVRPEPVTGHAGPEPGARQVRPEPGANHVGPEPGANGVQPESVPSNVRPKPAPDGAPQQPAPDAIPPQPSTMSDTGSFHLPPPQLSAPDAQPQSGPQPQPEPQPPRQSQPHPQPQQAWHETQQFPTPLHPRHLPVQPPTPPTSLVLPAPTPPYAQPFDPTPTPTPTQVPSPHLPVAPPAYASTASYTARSPQVPSQAGAVPERRGRRARPRPGPPAKVAVPVLLLALACFAVGFWALSRI
ncbi:protein kinase [Streptomyces sp. R35]|uniref:non-specific serine/threonine protein kinase n=1 Tax=Streptomyces sp. R35 TaxID=3238630 RepID=A0AB39S9X9_9ACTN